MTVDVIIEMASTGMTGGEGHSVDTGQRDDSRPRQDRAGQHEVFIMLLRMTHDLKLKNCLFLELSVSCLETMVDLR